MTDVVAHRKVAALRGRIARIGELLPSTADRFIADRTPAEALILNLFVALQDASDLAMHLVADGGLGVPGDARGAYELLGRAGVVTPDLARRLAAAVGLRNRIAHEYGGLDLGLVYEAARDDLGDLEAFAAAAAATFGR